MLGSAQLRVVGDNVQYNALSYDGSQKNGYLLSAVLVMLKVVTAADELLRGSLLHGETRAIWWVGLRHTERFQTPIEPRVRHGVSGVV